MNSKTLPLKIAAVIAFSASLLAACGESTIRIGEDSSLTFHDKHHAHGSYKSHDKRRHHRRHKHGRHGH